MANGAIQKPLTYWPKTLTGVGCTHTSWAGSGTVAQIQPTRLLLTPAVAGETFNTQPHPTGFIGGVTAPNNFAIREGHYLIINNGVAAAELVKVVSVNRLYLDLAAAPTAVYGAGSTFQIVDPIGYWPIRSMIIRNTGGGAATVTNGYNMSRSLAAAAFMEVGSDWTIAEPLMIGATGTTVIIDEIAR